MQIKKQNLTYHIDPSIPMFLKGDRGRLAQVIINLLINAVKFTSEHGRVHLSASAINESSEAVTLQIEVSDTGIGISEEQQKDIFNVFYKIDDRITSIYSGAGLGLPISKRIVEMMDGKIWVESSLEKGSKFVFTCKMQQV